MITLNKLLTNKKSKKRIKLNTSKLLRAVKHREHSRKDLSKIKEYKEPGSIKREEISSKRRDINPKISSYSEKPIITNL